MSQKHVVIIGAGIVGLATAKNLLAQNPRLKISVVEKEKSPNSHQTGHNSGVIHSGIYYKPGSEKAKNCRRGYQLLLEHLNNHGLKYDLCGKIIVATRKEEVSRLKELKARGEKNGLTDLKWLEASDIKEFEPEAIGLAALHVPQAGIVNYTEVGKSYADEIQSLGGELLLDTEVTAIKNNVVTTSNGLIPADYIVNCAGLQSDRLALMRRKKLDMRIIPFRGDYFLLKNSRKHLVKNLIYPVPDPAFPFLGVHFTRMIDGSVEVGPNAVLSLAREEYSRWGFNWRDVAATMSWPGFYKIAAKHWATGFGELHRAFSKQAFTKALQRLVPAVQAEDLAPAAPGIRAQACLKNGALVDDFLFLDDENMTHVCNAPSPAATSSLSIGLSIAQRVTKALQ